ncbi:MAG: tRNA (N6-threonylcarbamoyladenosine(37)-N6)-methyltransferase TrmO [Candidatus Solibacter sp.]|nr:tRNA (N6-threonylcarbamoyladenosine(37)-N6)-methyltransferase TrmO [Candidatus Solibacter sp.]
MTIEPVGRILSPITGRKAMPPWGLPAVLEIFPRFTPALLEIEKHSHIWVLAWLDQGRGERHVLQVTPRGVRDSGPGGLHGVFAVRSPARPNPIGLTATRIERIDGARIHVDRLDFLDQTPIVDIKPYFVTRDLIFSANGRQVGRNATREALRESLAAQAVAFHGRLTADVALAVRIVEHYRLTHHQLNDPASWHIQAPATRPELLDALTGITRVTLGRRTLVLSPAPEIVISDEAAYTPLPSGLSAGEALAAPEEALFAYRPVTS